MVSAHECDALQTLFPFLTTLEDLPDGWQHVVERLAERVAEVVPRHRWCDRDPDYGLSLDVRERWGVLRVDVWGAGDSRAEIDRLVEDAEDASMQACQHAHCIGRAQRLVRRSGYVVVACAQHAPAASEPAGGIRRYGLR